MRFAILPILMLATSAMAATSPAAAPHTVSCKAYNPAKAVSVVIDLQALPGTDNVLLTVDGTSTSLAKTVEVIIGQPGTRLAGTTWYQIGRFEPVEINALVASAPGEDGVHADAGSSVELNGATIPVGCLAY